MLRRLLPVLLLFVTTADASAGAKLTYNDFVNRLTDLEGLAVLPAPGEKFQQWSNYDRASKYDETTGKYVDWNANNDCCGIIQTGGDQQVFAEMEGPGVIWRIWSAFTDEGHVRIYLDGSNEPAVDLPFSGYFDGKTYIHPWFTMHPAGKTATFRSPFRSHARSSSGSMAATPFE